MRATETQKHPLFSLPIRTDGQELVVAMKLPMFNQFVEHHRLRVKRDECGDEIVRGRFGHLYEHDANQLGIVLDAPPDNLRSDRTLRARRRRAVAAGFVVHQEGECEAILLFDPSDRKQALLAIRLIHAKKIRKAAAPTDAQLQVRALFSSKARSRRLCFDQNTNAASGARDDAEQWKGRAQGTPRIADEGFSL